MKKTGRLIATAICLIGVSQPALAVNLWCTGTISRVYVDSGARVFVKASYHPSYTQICDLDTTWKGVNPDTCKAWFAMVQGAYHAQTSVIIFYSGLSEASCDEIPTYGGAHGPGYVMNRD